MTANLDVERNTAWRMFLTAHAVVVDLIEQELNEVGLPPLAWYDVLSALSLAPEHRLRMHELAAAIVLDRSNLTRLVDRLEAKGLVCRKTCSTDRRGAFAALTQEGTEMLQKMQPVYQQAIAKHFSRYLNDTEVKVLTNGLQRMQVKNFAAPTKKAG